MQNQLSNDKNLYQFWIASSSFFESSLFFAPRISSHFVHQKPGENFYSVNLTLRDADGSIVNTVSCEYSVSQVGYLDLSQLMECYKYESGIKHGIVDIESHVKINVQCRIYAQSFSTVMGQLLPINNSMRAIYPVRFSEGRFTVASLVNLSKEATSIKCKLFLGKRSPEVICNLPAGSCRLLNLEAEFSDCAELFYSSGANSVLGYLRLTPRNEISFATQVLECYTGGKENIYSSIT